MLSLAVLMSLAVADPGVSWTGFRGAGDSVVAGESLPLTWNEKEHVLWSVELAGYGQSSPVVWGDAIYVTSVEGENKESLLIACYDLATGKRRWQHSAEAFLKTKSTEYVSKAAPTPVVDAAGVVAFFESGDLIALDHAGKVRWTRSLLKDYGAYEGNHGLGTSPAQTAEHVILLVDHGGPSYLAAFQKSDGKTAWKTDRESKTSWSSPVVVGGEKGPEILISSNGAVESYNATDGKQRWRMTGLKGNTVASPSAVDDVVVIGAGDKGMSLALKRNGSGELDETAVAWRAEAATSSFGSPLVYRGKVYFVSKAGVGFCLDLATGKELWNLRLGDTCWASPIGAGDRVYFFMKKGETIVYRADGDRPEEIARNPLPELKLLYGVAATESSLILRGGNRLVRLGK